jgi:hypothetical protein
MSQDAAWGPKPCQSWGSWWPVGPPNGSSNSVHLPRSLVTNALSALSDGRSPAETRLQDCPFRLPLSRNPTQLVLPARGEGIGHRITPFVIFHNDWISPSRDLRESAYSPFFHSNRLWVTVFRRQLTWVSRAECLVTCHCFLNPEF